MPARSVRRFTLLLALLAAPALAGAVDFSGTWQVDHQKSDDAETLIAEAAGPDQVASAGRTRLVPTPGQAKEPDRVLLREQLMALAAETRELEITQSPTQIEVAAGEQVRIHYFGREHTRQTRDGQTLKCRLSWKGEQLVIEQQGDRGLRVTEMFTLLPGGDQLIDVVHIQGGDLPKPLEIKRIYNRVPAR